jgi:hypothetical protein
MQYKKLSPEIQSEKIHINKSGRRTAETQTRDKRTGMSMLVLFEENANI